MPLESIPVDGFLNIMLCLYLFVLALENSSVCDIFQQFLANIFSKNRKRLFAYIYIMGDIWDSLERGKNPRSISEIKVAIRTVCNAKNIDIDKEVQNFIQSGKKIKL